MKKGEMATTFFKGSDYRLMQDITSFDAKLMWGSLCLYILLMWAQNKIRKLGQNVINQEFIFEHPNNSKLRRNLKKKEDQNKDL